jgi:putative tryptophan/tyrosine transport system substrate-binding protein
MQSSQLNRRELMVLLGSAAAAWPLAARAQQSDRMRRIGVLMNFSETNPQSRNRVAAFQQSVEKLDGVTGRRQVRNPLARYGAN